MNAVFQLWFYGVAVISTLILGMPFALLGLGEENKRIFLPISMLTGTGTLIVITYYISYLGGAIKTFAVPLYVVLLCCSLVVCIICKKRFSILMDIGLDDIIKACVCLCAGIIVLAPVILYNGGFTYTDTYTYVSIADVLQDTGYNKIVENNVYKPYLTQINLYQTQGYRIGAQMLLAFFTALFSRTFSLELYSPVAALGVVLCGCGAWVFVELNYRLNKKSSLISVLLVVLNVPVIIWSAIYGFLPQIYGFSFFMASFGLLIAIVRDNSNGITRLNYIYCAMFIALIGLTYNELLPFWVLTVVFFLTMLIVVNRKIKGILLSIFKKLVVIATVAIIILGPYFFKMLNAILAQLKVNSVGWEHQGGIWTFVGYILGTVPADFYYESGQYDKWSEVYYFVLTAVLVLLVVGAIFKLYKENERLIICDFVAAFLPFAMMLIYFIFFAVNPFGEGRGNKWSIYKVVQYATIIVLPYSGVLLSSLWEKRKEIVSIVVIVLLASSIRNGIVYADQSVEPIRQLTGNRENPIGEYYKLYNTYKNETRMINLIGAPETHRKLVTYFLQNNLLMSDWGSDSYFYVYHDYVPEYDAEGIILQWNPYSENAIANYEELQQLPITFELGENFYSQETNGTDVWNWCDGRGGVLKIINFSPKKKMKVSFEISCVDTNLADIVISNENGEILEIVSVNNQKRERVELILEFGDETGKELYLSYDGSEIMTEIGRNITFCLWNIIIEEY